MTAAETIKFSRPSRVVHNDGETETIPNEHYNQIVTPSDATTQEQMFIVETSGTLRFWDEPEEDCYSESDGDDV